MTKYLVCIGILCCGAALAEPRLVSVPAQDKATPGVLQRGEFGAMSCPLPIQPKTKTGSVKVSSANAKRFIHARGVGEVLIAHKVPDSINQLEGGPYDAAFKKAAAHMEHYDAMAKGHFNMSGNPTIRLNSLDLVITRALDDRVLSLSAGPQLRTPEGTGVGSTLHDLKDIHGGFKLHSVPEPYHCAVSAKGLPFVSFMYTDCAKACRGEGAVKVYVGGAHYDHMKQAWQTPKLYPLPKGYKQPEGLYPEPISEK